MLKQLTNTFLLTILFLLTGCGGGSSDDAKALPDPVAAPVITNFTATKISIVTGESVELTAVFANGQGVINKGVGAITSGEAISVAPEITTTYTLTVTNTKGISVTKIVTITVSPPIPAPVITNFTATKTSIVAGESVELTAVFTNGQGLINKEVGAVTSGTAKSVTPDATTTYTLTVTNSEGISVKALLTITVSTPIPPPEIISFTASKTSIMLGESIDLIAVFLNGQGEINKGVGSVSSNTAARVTPSQTTSYRLTVTNTKGQSVSSLLTVTVNTPAPEIISFTASKTDILEGETIEFTVNFINGEGIINGGVGSVSSNIAISVAPTATTTYTLTVTNAKGVSVTAQLTINVTSPHIGNFWTDYDSQILPGNSAWLKAAFSGGEGSIDKGIGSVNSSEGVTVRPEHTTTYTLTVTNAFGASRTAQLTIEVLPVIVKFSHPSRLVKDDFNVAVGVYSTIEVVGVSANIADSTISLSPITFQGKVYFEGTFSLKDKAKGDYTLTATATDIKGGEHSFTKTITYDLPPEAAFSPSVVHGLARPELEIKASCTDDVGDCDITVFHGSFAIISGKNSVKTTYDFSDFNGQVRILSAVATDKEGQRNERPIETSVYVDTSPELASVKVFSGHIIDLTSQKVLLHNQTINGDTLDIADIATNAKNTVPVAANSTIDNTASFLTPAGAMYTTYITHRWGDVNYLFDWNQGELVSLGQNDLLSVVGDFMAYDLNSESHNGSKLWLRQFSTQTTSLVSDQVSHSNGSDGTHGYYSFDLATNGIVGYKFWNPLYTSPIFKFENNAQVQVTTEAGGESGLLTDGQHFIFRKGYAIAMHDGNNEIMLTDIYDWNSFNPTPHDFYAINNGWVAYVDLGNLKQTNVWSRDIHGNIQQRTFFGKDALIETLAENGDIMVISGNNRYLSKPNSDSVLVSSSLGESQYKNGSWYIAIGNTLFTLTTP